MHAPAQLRAPESPLVLIYLQMIEELSGHAGILGEELEAARPVQ